MKLRVRVDHDREAYLPLLDVGLRNLIAIGSEWPEPRKVAARLKRIQLNGNAERYFRTIKRATDAPDVAIIRAALEMAARSRLNP